MYIYTAMKFSWISYGRVDNGAGGDNDGGEPSQ